MAPEKRPICRRTLVLTAMAAVAVVAMRPESVAVAKQASGPLAKAAGGLNNVRGQAARARGARPLGEQADRLLTEARRLSPTVRRQLAELAASDLIVFVELRIPRSLETGQLAFVGASAGVRYVKIEIYGGYSVRTQAPWLAHELQHALEIAAAPEVSDDAGFRRLYQRIGRRSRGGLDSFESQAAIDVTRQVLAELR